MTKTEALRDEVRLELIEARLAHDASEARCRQSILEALRIGMSQMVITIHSGANKQRVAQLAADMTITCTKCGKTVPLNQLSRIERCPPCTKKWVTT